MGPIMGFRVLRLGDSDNLPTTAHSFADSKRRCSAPSTLTNSYPTRRIQGITRQALPSSWRQDSCQENGFRVRFRVRGLGFRTKLPASGQTQVMLHLIQTSELLSSQVSNQSPAKPRKLGLWALSPTKTEALN